MPQALNFKGNRLSPLRFKECSVQGLDGIGEIDFDVVLLFDVAAVIFARLPDVLQLTSRDLVGDSSVTA